MWPPGHFYSPIPDRDKLSREPMRSRVWPARPHSNPAIDWHGGAQLELCAEVFAKQAPMRFAADATGDPREYFVRNQQYQALDGWILQAMLRHLRPARMIEIGSGYSSLLAARVNREFLDGQMVLTCIDPQPPPFLTEGVPGISSVRVEEVQDTPLELFEDLRAGDVLFMDTSHTVKTGGEVPWIFSRIIPQINPGVAVHIHDIFLPGDYPEEWVLEQGRGWNEIYLVEAFLTCNSAFEVVFGAQWMIQNQSDALLEAFPDLIDRRKLAGPVPPAAVGFVLNPLSGAALWLRRTN
jgi:predicted O-methyltransferase YrrM